ncbi:MAG TPA: hypothetical protein VFB06_28605 [Streptosporangiaceae bacterium]|nr:hypothetical protein [Streptosporangiaceae bacterium]
MPEQHRLTGLTGPAGSPHGEVGRAHPLAITRTSTCCSPGTGSATSVTCDVRGPVIWLVFMAESAREIANGS